MSPDNTVSDGSPIQAPPWVLCLPGNLDNVHRNELEKPATIIAMLWTENVYSRFQEPGGCFLIVDALINNLKQITKLKDYQFFQVWFSFSNPDAGDNKLQGQCMLGVGHPEARENILLADVACGVMGIPFNEMPLAIGPPDFLLRYITHQYRRLYDPSIHAEIA
jgi:hypothetical protein